MNKLIAIFTRIIYMPSEIIIIRIKYSRKFKIFCLRQKKKTNFFVKNLSFFLSLSLSINSYTPSFNISEIHAQTPRSLEYKSRRSKIAVFPVPAYRSVGIYTCCSVGQRYIEFVGDWIRSEEVDFLVGGYSRPSHDPLWGPLSGSSGVAEEELQGH